MISLTLYIFFGECTLYINIYLKFMFMKQDTSDRKNHVHVYIQNTNTLDHKSCL